jgi:hypothetical protein
MSRNYPASTALLPILFLMLFAFATVIPAQFDPDPNSPTPILRSEAKEAARVYAVRSAPETGKDVTSAKNVFFLGDLVRVYVTGIDLMSGEGSGAFRIYATDGNKHMFRFPVLSVSEIKAEERTYELTFRIHDEIGFWEQPSENGDLLVMVTWRGLASNQLLLGLGRTGGLKAETSKADFRESKLAIPTDDYVGYRWSGDRIRFLEQATFGPTEELDQRIRRIGIRSWLAEQFDAPYPSAANPYPEFALKPSNISSGCPFNRGTPESNQCLRDYYSIYPLQTWFFRESFYGNAQLRHRVAWAFSQLWVTSFPTIQQSSHMIAYHKVLSQNAFGNYRTLMKEMTLNPAMGDYLDMARSTKNSPNENYAREILQLFTIGLFMLNPDGTYQLDGNNEPVPTYDQDTVNNFTKVFTGWTFCNTGCPNSTLGAVNSTKTITT